jgi:hypothetical protein
MLHVHGGSLLLEKLQRAGVPGDRLEWSEVLCQGPTPAGLADDAWYALRAAFLTAAYGPVGDRDVRKELAAQDAALMRASAQDEIVLWFGPELFCQAILVRLLARLAERPRERTRLALVCVDSYPGVDDHRACTLGALSGDQLAELFNRRENVTPPQLALARRAWEAVGAATPEPLAALARADTSALPFLGAALSRLLAELPDAGTGLSRTEKLILDALPTPRRSLDVFVGANTPEPRRWLTDAIFFDHVRRLATGPHPLIEVAAAGAGPDDLAHADLARTPWADDVLAGRKDAIALRGIDRWVGGTHLKPDNVWRWDEAKSQVTRG